MLGNLFPNTFGSSKDGNSSLDSGSKFGLLGTEKEKIQSAAQLPSIAKTTDVLNAAKIRGQMEAQISIQKRLSEENLGLMDAALQVQEIRINHAGQVMQKEDRYQKQIAKHGKNYLGHTINQQANQSNFSGYEAEFQAARNSINL